MEFELFLERVRRLLKEQGKSFDLLEAEVGVAKHTLYRGVRRRSTVAAIAYYLQMNANELVYGTELGDMYFG